MKLKQLYENKSQLKLYKGINKFNGYDNYKHNIGDKGTCVPGFLSTYEIGRIYSDPTLTGEENDQSIIISVSINPTEIIDYTDYFIEWCDKEALKTGRKLTLRDYDISSGFPYEWREGSIWTVGTINSAHSGVNCYNNNDFVFCGVKKPYIVIKHYNNYNEWVVDKTAEAQGPMTLARPSSSLKMTNHKQFLDLNNVVSVLKTI